jgi:hypothetical protein
MYKQIIGVDILILNSEGSYLTCIEWLSEVQYIIYIEITLLKY